MTEPVRLMPFSAADHDFLARLASDPRVTAFIGDGRPWTGSYLSQRMEQALQDPGVQWFIARQEKTPVGFFTATRRSEAVEIGYWVDPQFWGRGIAGLMIPQGLSLLADQGATTFIARAFRNNTGSLKLLERNGFTRQGTDDEDLVTLTLRIAPNTYRSADSEVSEDGL